MTKSNTVKPMFTISAAAAKNLIEDLSNRNKALDLKVQHLEYVLAQRIVNTENKFAENSKRFDVIEQQLLKIFRDYPAEPFSYRRIEQECRVRLPHLSIENIGRRMRSLFSEGALWRDIAKEDNPDIYQEKGKTQYWLKLEELE
jgi:hypothetical protein